MSGVYACAMILQSLEFADVEFVLDIVPSLDAYASTSCLQLDRLNKPKHIVSSKRD